MSSEDRTRSTARGEELRENLADTDARRAEEEAAKAQEATEEAQKEQEKEEREAQEERERAQRVHQQADQARTQADEAVAGAATPGPTGRTSSVAAGGEGTSTPLDKLPPAAQRPEVLVGAAFVGTFLLARILKRLFD
jgi:cobalamin biosynthesis Mg chelatase CobN